MSLPWTPLTQISVKRTASAAETAAVSGTCPSLWPSLVAARCVAVTARVGVAARQRSGGFVVESAVVLKSCHLAVPVVEETVG